MIDWGGLTRDLSQLNKTWTPISQGQAIDFEGLNKELGYDSTEEDNRIHYKTGINVEFTEDGTPWYEVIPGALGASADWIAGIFDFKWLSTKFALSCYH